MDDATEATQRNIDEVTGEATAPTTHRSPGPPAEHPFMPGRLGFASEHDLDEFVATLSRYERGELSADEWRAFRLIRGVYGQRQPDVQMLRIKIPQGILTAPQLRAVAQVARQHADGILHLTTRQNIQLHFMPLAQVETAMRSLAEVGLTTREACGHSVRNITACPLAGVSPTEIFDVTPYADALTRFLLRGPLSSTLPRKFKVAFEGCNQGCVQPAINDLAFIARVEEGRRGFLVLCGGGLATLPRAAQTLCEFLPAQDLLAAGLAVLRVFHREGNRRNKHKARLKWVIERVGFEAFRAQFERERDLIRQEGDPPLPFPPDAPPVEPTPPRRAPLRAIGEVAAAPGFDRWSHENVTAQKQAGFAAASIRLPLGDFRVDQALELAALAERFADGTLRTTSDQNLVLRYVPVEDLAALHSRLGGLGLALAGAGTLADVTSCPGADTCNLAVTASRGVALRLTEHLAQATTGDLASSDAHIKVSGCPNGCGQHHVATLGFQGGLRKIGGRALPVYHLTVGGSFGSHGARFGRLVGKIPARRAHLAVDRLLALWRRERSAGESLDRFYGRVELDAVRRAVADLVSVDERSAVPEDYVDLGQSDPFAVFEGQGECAS
jgi:sulfite reductase (NADPH) hemoprotein beta-component